MKIDHKNKSLLSHSLFFLKFSASVTVVLTLMLALRFVLKLANVAEGDGLISSLIYNVTDLLVRPITDIVTPLTFSSGAMVELSSFLLAVVFISISGIFLGCLYLRSYEPLQVRSIRI